MTASITIHPRSPESAGEMVRRFTRLGYSLSNCRGRIVARRDVVVRMPSAGMNYARKWLSEEEMKR
jgi:hypothetical protein